MGKQPTLLTRLRPEQEEEIAKVKAMRNDVLDLIAIVSHGSYKDEDLKSFWSIADNAGLVLHISNAELAERAGLGSQYIVSVSRQKRRPKLANLLKALNAILNVANERLFDIDRKVRTGGRAAAGKLSLSQDCPELKLTAISLAALAKREIERIDDERRNDAESITNNARLRNLLQIFADGFEHIAVALDALEPKPNEPVLLGDARAAVDNLGKKLNSWWALNGSEAVNWGIRIPILGAGVGLLKWLGADMTVATSAVSLIVGGELMLKAWKDK